MEREDAGGGGNSGAGGGADDLDRSLARYPLTDLGNAERFAARNEKRLRYCPEIGWLWWDGKHWSPHGADEIVKLREHDCVRAIQREAEAIRRTTDDYGSPAHAGMVQNGHRSEFSASSALSSALARQSLQAICTTCAAHPTTCFTLP